MNPTAPGIQTSRLTRWARSSWWLEWLLIVLIVVAYSRTTLLDFNPQQLQQTGEHNESATLPILAEIGLWRAGEIPLWNPYMLTGFPHAGDFVNHFWNPVATLPVLLWGGINGMKVSIFLSLVVAGLGQWVLAHVFGARGAFRLWSGALFALSGGLALLWYRGWYELLVGAAWFPWCFALLWLALRRRDRRSLVWAALAVALVLTTGGGYYPLYLALSLGVLSAIAFFGGRLDRRRVARRALAVAALGLALSAVYLVPLVDGWRYTARDAPPDLDQVTAQPIAYALFNTVVSDRAWYRAEVLNKGSSWGWYYLGLLPLAALAFLPWVYGRYRWRRPGIAALLLLLLALLLWSANRTLPVRWLYDHIPFLYTFRFSGRLILIAVSPLLAAAALGLQGVLVGARAHWRGARLGVVGRRPSGSPARSGLPVLLILNLAAVLVLGVSVVNVFRANRSFGMIPQPRNAIAREALTWLRAYDPGLYYTNIGGGYIYWDWMAYAYELEMPVLNFRYNRRVRTMDAQYSPLSPFSAQPRYVLASADQPPPEGATLLNTFQGINLWRRDDVLPFAFVVTPGQPVTPGTVRPAEARLDGPNRVVVSAVGEAVGEHLVVLVSDYPGWQMWVNGERAELRAVNGYLGAALGAGEQTVVFEFRPGLYTVGLVISITALIVCLGMIVTDFRARPTGPGYSPPAIVGDQRSPE